MVRAGTSALASHTSPTTTARSSARCVSRKVLSARRTTSAYAASPTPSRRSAAGLFGSGTGGSRLGQTSAERPRPTTTPIRRACRTSSCRTVARPRGSGNADSARMTAPTGSVAPPVIATTPFAPNQTPGVAKPCSASSAAMTANAVPTSTVLVSARRAPRIVRPLAAPAATSALKPTEYACISPVKLTGLSPTVTCSTAGVAAAAPPSSATGHSCSLSPLRTTSFSARASPVFSPLFGACCASAARAELGRVPRGEVAAVGAVEHEVDEERRVDHALRDVDRLGVLDDVLRRHVPVNDLLGLGLAAEQRVHEPVFERHLLARKAAQLDLRGGGDAFCAFVGFRARDLRHEALRLVSGHV